MNRDNNKLTVSEIINSWPARSTVDAVAYLSEQLGCDAAALPGDTDLLVSFPEHVSPCYPHLPEAYYVRTK